MPLLIWKNLFFFMEHAFRISKSYSLYSMSRYCWSYLIIKLYHISVELLRQLVFLTSVNVGGRVTPPCCAIVHLHSEIISSLVLVLFTSLFTIILLDILFKAFSLDDLRLQYHRCIWRGIISVRMTSWV